MTQKKAINHN